MNRTKAKSRTADIVVAGVMIVVGGLAIVNSAYLPPPVLEPVGPAAFPLWAGVGLVTLSLVMLAQAFRRRAAPDEPEVEETLGGAPGPTADDFRRRDDLALATVGLTVLFVAVMQLGWLGFRWSAVVYSFSVMAILAWGRWRVLPVALGLALILGVGLHLVFTNFFYIDLPS